MSLDKAKRELAEVEARMDRLRANYKVPLAGGSRAKTTTFNARMDDLAERRAFLLREVREAEAREGVGGERATEGP
jgi:cupin superfamily acireductone dioxygenase involved in methionine salvage